MDGATGPIRVLHIEDDPELADLTATHLSRVDDRLSVEHAPDATTGLERLGQGHDCVISDYEMPGRDGIELLEVVRADHPDLPFILFTGKGSEAVAARAISAGVTDYLQKGTGTEQFAILANRITNAVRQYRAERTARTTEQRLTELAENSNDILWTFTADWSECVFINSPYEEIWGRPRSELDENPRAFLEGVHPDDRAQVRDAMASLSEGKSVDLEFRVNASEEFRRSVWVQGEPVERDGEVVRVVGFARDISVRTRREQVLKELHRTVTDLQSYSDEAGVYDRTVEAALNILEFDMCVTNAEQDGRLVVTAASETLPEDGRRAMSVDEGLAGKTYRSGESFLVGDVSDYPVAKPQGSYRSAVSVPIGDHGVFQAVSERPSAYDETDLELAELLVAHTARALDRIEQERDLEQYKRMVNAAGDMVYRLDTDGIIRAVNDTAETLTGYAREELVDSHVRRICEPDDVAAGNEFIGALLSDERTPETDAFSWTLVAADGEPVPVESQITPLFEGEAWLGTVGVVRDVSEQRRRRRELQRQNERLEQFTSIVSHDLQNPLGIARGRVQLAQEECDSEDLDGAIRALDRMDALIEDLLTLARNGEDIGEQQPVDIGPLADRCWGMVGTADATLSVETDRAILADPTRLTELFENLFSNAVEHGGPAVTVMVGELPDGEGLYVADDGTGIGTDRRDQLFESGYSTDDSGTGFGLAIVREIAEAHGWSVSLHDDGGTRVEIRGPQFVDRPDRSEPRAE